MVTTVAEAFRQFRSNLEITSLQESTTSTRQSKVRDAVARDFSVLESFLTGSYRRNAMIAPLSTADVDVSVVLDPKYYATNNQHALLSASSAVLRA
ncbi:SMODS domain-containing nucleotidyltransferase [Agrobacterium pusense]|uniref:SMODS domain-containing nucleotidyltransferase n=1 Tax=Agrobacterium pusense TaxID=648995 RepID=UPI0028A86ACE|nr:nucleotidyltransferase domain-containing protein [Agrobacterium pusense]